MKIGILTFHDGINHGAYLQAFSLQKKLLAMGYNSEIINYKSLEHTLKEYKVFLFKRDIKILLSNINKIRKFKKAHKKLNMTKRIYSMKANKLKKFDIVFLGSDEIWNYMNKLIGLDLTYFGKNIDSNILASYAPSFGEVNTNSELPREIKELINKLDFVSVRDNNSRQIVENNLNKETQVVLDPTFLVDYNEELLNSVDYKNYILLYLTGMSEKEVFRLKKVAKKLNKKLISIGYFYKASDINIVNLSPFEWMNFFKKADYIITSSYHGTIFSIKNQKEFCSIVTKEKSNKITHLLKMLKIENRLIDKGLNMEKQIEVLFNEEKGIDYSMINGQLNNKINESEYFLKEVLEFAKEK